MPRYIEDEEDDLLEFEDEYEEELPPPRKKRRAPRPASPTRPISAILGAVLLIVAIAGFAWFAINKQPLSFLPTFPTSAPANPSQEQVPPLLAAGITLQHPTQAPVINQQQALLIASQLEPDAVTNAHTTTAQYVLLNYTAKNTSTTSLNHVPAWMILYQGIPLQPSDPAVDSTPFPQTQHDLYLFLNATTGKELLAIWV